MSSKVYLPGMNWTGCHATLVLSGGVLHVAWDFMKEKLPHLIKITTSTLKRHLRCCLNGKKGTARMQLTRLCIKLYAIHSASVEESLKSFVASHWTDVKD